MKEQPQRPEESQEQQDNLASAINKLAKNRTAWMLYAQSLERENTALTERFRYIRDAMEDIARHSEEERIKEYAEKCLETLNRLEVK